MSSAVTLPLSLGTARQRRRRWDAGQVIVTERDVQVLRFAGEMYGVRSDVLHALLSSLSPTRGRLARDGLSDRAVRLWLERIERGGYLTRRRLLGHVWVTPTRTGLDLAGLPFERWNFGARLRDDAPGGWALEHVHAVALVRLVLQAELPGGTWVAEREFRRQRQLTGARVRVPDGAIDVGERRIGIEVELTGKKPDKYLHILRDSHVSLDELRWYTKPALRPWLERTLAATPKPPRPVVSAHELPGLAT